MSNGRKNSSKYSYPWILCALLIIITSLSYTSDASVTNFYIFLTDTVPSIGRTADNNSLPATDTLPVNDTIPLTDTLPSIKDSLTTRIDTLNLSKDTLDEAISYKATDSIVFIIPEKKNYSVYGRQR